MRIAFLSPFYPFRGGIAQFSTFLYKALEEKGHSIKAYSFSRQYPNLLFPGSTQYVEAHNQTFDVGAEFVLDSINPFSYQKTVREILAWQPEMVVISYWMSFFVPALGHVANRLRKKEIRVSCVIHNAIPHEPKFFDIPLAKLFFRQCDDFIVMSDAVEKDLLALHPKAKYKLSPHPLYTHFGEKIDKKEAQQQLAVSADKKTLLFFGLIRDYKGLDWLVQALSFLDDSYQLVIAGESYGSFDKYEEQIGQSPAADRIKVYNEYIDDKRVPVFFSASDLLILPYKSATQSGVISVAYHFDLPVLATDVGGLRQSLEPNGTGLICAPSPESIAEGIQHFFASGSESFVEAIAKEKARLTWDKFAEELLNMTLPAGK